jgi:hypothetical protein
MKKSLLSSLLTLLVFGNVATCLADVTLSYSISDTSNMFGHDSSATETSPIGTAVPGGVEYDFAFGAFGNKNWNWSIGRSKVSLILFGPQDDPTGAKLFLSGTTNDKPLSVTYSGPDRRNNFGDQVEINFSATFSPLAAPLSKTAGLFGNIKSMNPRLTADPSMLATATGSGGFGTVSFDSTIGAIPETLAVSSLQGDIKFTWNKQLQVNGDTVTFSQAFVAVSVPEPSSVVLAAFGAFFVVGAWLVHRKRNAAAQAQFRRNLGRIAESVDR